MAKEEKFIAKHLIPMTVTPGKPGDKAKGIAPVKPKVKEIKPGERIMLDPEDDETKFLLSAGAVEKAPSDDEKGATSAKAAPAKRAATTTAKKPAAKKDDEKTDDDKDLV